MSMFTLATSCLAISSLPLFMDLIVQVPVQYCSWQHQTLLSSPDTSRTGHCFCFGSTSSFLLELFLGSSVAYWTPTELGSSSFSVIFFFCLLYCSWGSQGKNAEVVCPSHLRNICWICWDEADIWDTWSGTILSARPWCPPPGHMSLPDQQQWYISVALMEPGIPGPQDDCIWV